MVTRVFQSGGSRKFAVDYATGRLALDLTADRSTLQDGQASVVVGRDVLNRNRLARGPGRKPVLTNRDTDEFQPRGPLTTAIRSNFHGNATQFYRETSGPLLPGGWNPGGSGNAWQNCGYIPPSNAPGARGQLYLRDNEDDDNPHLESFSAKMLGGLFRLTKYVSYIRPKTIVEVRPQATPAHRSAIFFDEAEWAAPGSRHFFMDDLANPNARGRTFDFTIFYREFYDKRGIWVSDGQSFWLLHNGQYTKYLNLGDDSGTLGTEWRGSQISPMVFMFVATNQLPRVIQLNALPAAEAATHSDVLQPTGPPKREVTEVGDTQYLAGLLPPSSDVLQERNALDFGGTPVDSVFLGGPADEDASSSLTGYENPTAETEVQYRVKARVVDDATGAASEFVNCYTTSSPVEAPGLNHRHPKRLIWAPVYPMGTTTVNGFFVRDAFPEEGESRQPLKTGRATHIEFWRTTSLGIDYFRELVKPVGWPRDSFEDGRLDPQYTTLVEFDPEFPGIFARASWGVLGMSDEELLGSSFSLTRALGFSGGLPPACRDVISIQAMTVCGGAGTEDVFYVQQDKQVVWPRLSSDEEIIHSEIKENLNLVESFYYGDDIVRGSDLRRLSRAGDTFQAFTVAGDVALAIMRHGAHVIRRVGDSVETQALAERGAGTPWPKTVLSIGDVAMWATTNGLRIYNPTANDGAGVLSLIQYEEMSDWFAEALREGMDVEAGFDERRGTLHFRRSLDGEFVDGAVYNLKFKAWSLMEDDNGFRYVSSTHADTAAKEAAALYSIGTDGSIFEVNYEGVAHPYDGLGVQGVIEEGGHYPPEHNGFPQLRSIISVRGPRFSPAMVGDIIRFRSPRAALDGQWRIIDGASSSLLQFDIAGGLPVPLADGDEFIIGAVPFRVRWHPVTGAFAGNVKTLETLEVVARPGPRHSENPLWPDRPEAKLTVRAYRDIGDSPIEEQIADIPIFADEDAEFVADDRFSKAEIQGTVIEIELESLDARTDFVLTRTVGRYREDGDQQSDASTTD